MKHFVDHVFEVDARDRLSINPYDCGKKVGLMIINHRAPGHADGDDASIVIRFLPEHLDALRELITALSKKAIVESAKPDPFTPGRRESAQLIKKLGDKAKRQLEARLREDKS